MSRAWKERAKQVEQALDEHKSAYKALVQDMQRHAAYVAEARREEAYHALSQCAVMIANAPHITSIDETRRFIEAFRTRYDPPVPASVTLGGYTVTWRGENSQHFIVHRDSDLIGLFPTAPQVVGRIAEGSGYVATPNEYAALHALGARQ